MGNLVEATVEYLSNPKFNILSFDAHKSYFKDIDIKAIRPPVIVEEKPKKIDYLAINKEICGG